MTAFDEDFYLLALHFIEGLGPVRANIILNHFKSAEAVFSAAKHDFAPVSNVVNHKILDQIVSKSSFKSAEFEIGFCLKQNIQIISNRHAEFPARLKYLEDKPLIIFKKGNIHPFIKKSLAIVGTRKSTEYGHRFIENLVEELKFVKDLTIVSGLALGVDQKAHSQAVKHNIPTIGVMGLALDKIYPSQNTNLAKSMLIDNGGWITETTSQDKITQGVFPRRNRLIAGMCDAIIVVESDIKGGSIITCQYANEYGKEVFALPGKVTDAQSRGCNDLIQANLALMINKPTDIIESMNWNTDSNKKINKAIEINFEGSASQKSILDIIRKSPKIEFEKILIEANMEHGQILESLLTLELEGLIHTLPGNKYELI